jgi:hypothetical protein
MPEGRVLQLVGLSKGFGSYLRGLPMRNHFLFGEKRYRSKYNFMEYDRKYSSLSPV